MCAGQVAARLVKSLEWEVSGEETWLEFDLRIGKNVIWFFLKDLLDVNELFALYRSHLVNISTIFDSYSDFSMPKWTTNIEIKLISLKFQ